MKTIKIAVIENNRFIRSSWEMIFKESAEFEIAGSYINCEDAINDEQISNADAILIDIKIPGIPLTDALKYFCSNYPNQVLIISTNYEDDENIFDAIAAGAAGFLPKNIPPHILCSSITDLVQGRSSMTPHIARSILDVIEKSDIQSANPAYAFTSAERNLLYDLSAGKSYSTIAGDNKTRVRDILQMIRVIYDKIKLTKNPAYSIKNSETNSGPQSGS